MKWFLINQRIRPYAIKPSKRTSLPIKVWTTEVSMRAWLYILRRKVFFREEKLHRPKLKKRIKTKV